MHSIALLTLAALAAPPSPAATPPDLRWIALPSGVTLRYAEQGDPAGPTVVLLHGYTDSWRSWELLLPHLPTRIHVIAIDLRGHGASDRPGRYEIPHFAADVTALLQALQLRDVTLVGHSLGSLVAREAARQAAGRVGRLVLIGSAPSFRNPGTEELLEAIVAAGDSIPPEFVEGFQRSTIQRGVPEDFLATMIEGSAAVPPAVWERVLRGQLDFRDQDRLGALRVPTMLMWGERDAIFSGRDQELLLAAIPGAHLVAYEDVGHAPHWEVPRLVVADLLAFLGDEVERR